MLPDSLLAPLALAFYEAPADFARRSVLADALLEAGDPRGEFIALQQHTSARARKRAQKLLDRHRAAFLGPLARVVVPGTDVWRGGFLVACEAQLNGTLAGEPSWATVERLAVHYDGHEPRELASPHLRSLRAVSLVLPVARWTGGAAERLRHAQSQVYALLLEGGRAAVARQGIPWAHLTVRRRAG